MTTLTLIHLEIDRRVQAIREQSQDWLCGKGCDNCCRRLAEIPRLTLAEWELLREGLDMLPPERLSEIRRDVAALAAQAKGLVVCPLLEQSTGACPVYVHRPVACRSYGFYVQRQLGLYCHDIEAQVNDGKLDNVLWGNHDAIDRQLAGLGETRSLTEWFDLWEDDTGRQ